MNFQIKFVLILYLMCFSLMASSASAAIIFQEDFESGNLNQWSYIGDHVSITTSEQYSGSRAAQIHYDPSLNHEGDANYLLEKLITPIHDTLYIRWYQKFSSSFDPPNGNLKLVKVRAQEGGNSSTNYWNTTWPIMWNSYEQHIASGFEASGHYRDSQLRMDQDNSLGSHDWGGVSNVFNVVANTSPTFKFQKNQWYCIEVMQKANVLGANNASSKDGEVMLFIDGNLILHVNNLNLRNYDQNFLTNKIMFASTYNPAPVPNDMYAWIDDVVIATSYIGPSGGGSPPPPPPPGNTIFANGSHGDSNNWSPQNAGRWQVSDQSGNDVYEINTSNFSNNGDVPGEFSTYPSESYSDFTVDLRAKTTENLGTNSYADYVVLFDYQDAQNFYYVMFNSDSVSTQLFRLQNGIRTALDTYSGSLIQDNNFHNIKVNRSGGVITISYDGNVVLSANDTTFSGGLIGVGSYNDAAFFDDIVVTQISGDVNLDGAVDANDINELRDQILGIKAQTAEADLNQDSNVNSVDLQLLINIVFA